MREPAAAPGPHLQSGMSKPDPGAVELFQTASALCTVACLAVGVFGFAGLGVSCEHFQLRCLGLTLTRGALKIRLPETLEARNRADVLVGADPGRKSWDRCP